MGNPKRSYMLRSGGHGYSNRRAPLFPPLKASHLAANSEPTFPDRRLIRPPCGNAIQLSRLSTTPDRPSWWGNFLVHPLTCELAEIRARTPASAASGTRSSHFLLHLLRSVVVQVFGRRQSQNFHTL